MADDRKTELPTRRKLEKSRERGMAPVSKELVLFFMLVCYVIFFTWTLGPFSREMFILMVGMLDSTPKSVHGDSLLHIMGGVSLIKPLLFPMFLLLIFGVLGHVLQRGVLFSFHPLKPDFEKISLIKGLSRVFSIRSVFELFSSLLKLVVISFAIWVAIKPHLSGVISLYDSDVIGIIEFANTIVLSVLLGASIVMVLIAAMDLLYRRFSYIQELKMTREELKDETKQQDLAPEIKAKLRKIRAERMKYHIMMSAVEDADVVITNPDHYAVALKYDAKAMPAPKVVAKGQGYIAMKIKALAYENGVVVIENKVLARALYQSVALGDFIPVLHYRAVAEVINYVYRLKRAKDPAGAAV